MSKRRDLTPDELADKARLLQLWEKEKARGATQMDMALRCGWTTQGAFWQYIKKNPLNYDALFRLAEAFRVPPAEISPTMAARLPVANLASGEMQLLKIFRTLSPRRQKLVYDLAESYSTVSAVDEGRAADNQADRNH